MATVYMEESMIRKILIVAALLGGLVAASSAPANADVAVGGSSVAVSVGSATVDTSDLLPCVKLNLVGSIGC